MQNEPTSLGVIRLISSLISFIGADDGSNFSLFLSKLVQTSIQEMLTNERFNQNVKGQIILFILTRHYRMRPLQCQVALLVPDVSLLHSMIIQKWFILFEQNEAFFIRD